MQRFWVLDFNAYTNKAGKEVCMVKLGQQKEENGGIADVMVAASQEVAAVLARVRLPIVAEMDMAMQFGTTWDAQAKVMRDAIRQTIVAIKPVGAVQVQPIASVPNGQSQQAAAKQ